MNTQILFKIGMGNKVIFLESLISDNLIKDKTKLIKYFLKKNIFENLPYEKIKFIFPRLFLLSLKALIKNKKIIVIGIDIPFAKKIILEACSIKRLKLLAYPAFSYKRHNVINFSELDFYKSLLKDYPLIREKYDEEIKKSYKVSYENKDYKSKFNRKIIALHLGSDHSSINKRPVPEIIAKAIKYIPNKNKYIFIVVGQNSDHEISSEFINIINSYNKNIEILNLVDKTNIFELIDLLKSSEILISGDSGVRQIADFIGLKNIVIFGPTSEVKNLCAPINHKRFVLRALKCKGYFYNICQCEKINNKPKCILSITSEMIYEKIKIALL